MCLSRASSIFVALRSIIHQFAQMATSFVPPRDQFDAASHWKVHQKDAHNDAVDSSSNEQIILCRPPISHQLRRGSLS